MSPNSSYVSYVLRLRKMQDDHQPTWVASVQGITTGEQRSFPNVQALATFLLATFQGDLPDGVLDVPVDRGLATRSRVVAMSPTPNAEPLHLLRTKLYRPRPTGELLHRSRLLDALDRYADRSVTLVCAPAGFGKTTILTDWLERCPGPSAWLSLDKTDGDPAVFLAYFIAAIRTLFPTACAETFSQIHAPVLPPVPSLAMTLTNDLDLLAEEPRLASGQRFVLVLDDYHLVHAQAVHTLLRELLRHPPRTMHLILSARQDPPFLEHSLRARGDFSEIRVAELRFTRDEAVSFMQHALDAPIEAGALAAVIEATEGWGTGLRLTALTLRAGGDVRTFEGASYNRYTSEYLLAEVLSRVPEATQEFLLKTSILDRLNGSLCDTVAPPADPAWDGRSYLDWLARENVFTFSLDPQGNWFRYHHLFQKLLYAQLERRCGKEEVAGLHARAAGWFARQGLVQEALEHALAAGDESLAVQLVEEHRHEAMNQEHWRQLEQWLAMVPRRLVDERPELLVLEAWVLQNHWRFGDLPGRLDRIEALLQQDVSNVIDPARLMGEVYALRSVVAYYRLDLNGAHEYAQRRAGKAAAHLFRCQGHGVAVRPEWVHRQRRYSGRARDAARGAQGGQVPRRRISDAPLCRPLPGLLDAGRPYQFVPGRDADCCTLHSSAILPRVSAGRTTSGAARCTSRTTCAGQPRSSVRSMGSATSRTDMLSRRAPSGWC